MLRVEFADLSKKKGLKSLLSGYWRLVFKLATVEGRSFVIDPGFFKLPPRVQDYIIAHELKHWQGRIAYSARHSSFTESLEEKMQKADQHFSKPVPRLLSEIKAELFAFGSFIKSLFKKQREMTEAEKTLTPAIALKGARIAWVEHRFVQAIKFMLLFVWIYLGFIQEAIANRAPPELRRGFNRSIAAFNPQNNSFQYDPAYQYLPHWAKAMIEGQKLWYTNTRTYIRPIPT